MKVSILDKVPLRLLCSLQVIDAPEAMMELHFREQLKNSIVALIGSEPLVSASTGPTP